MENAAVATEAREPVPPVATFVPPPAKPGASRFRLLEAALRREPTSFGFFQAVQLIEAIRREHAGVGRHVDPVEEAVRFGVNPSIAFPPSEIHSLAFPAEGAARMSVNFMGLTGPQSVLPWHYSLLVAERVRARDTALASFLDLFHHRILSLFYRAWARHRLAMAYVQEEDTLRVHLLDLVGLGSQGGRDRGDEMAERLAFHVGLVAPNSRSAVALEQLITDIFGVRAEVEQFVGGWYPLSAEDQCAVGEELGASTQLGLGAVVGDEVWDEQMRVRIRLGPLTRAEFGQFLPTGSAYALLGRVVRFFAQDQFEFEMRLVLAKDEVDGCVLGAEDQPLGWATWIRTTELAHDAEETLLSLHP
jgi:type VI secretion system protein ImpH